VNLPEYSGISSEKCPPFCFSDGSIMGVYKEHLLKRNSRLHFRSVMGGGG
jgi:hypothetical protein